jgi:hypothetical protein
MSSGSISGGASQIIVLQRRDPASASSNLPKVKPRILCNAELHQPRQRGPRRVTSLLTQRVALGEAPQITLVRRDREAEQAT